MRTRLGRTAAVALSLALAALVASCGDGDHQQVRSATLDGANETPPNGSAATGQATYRIAKDRQSIEFTLSVSNIQNVVAAHVHVGAPGVAGAIIFPLANGSFATLNGTLTADSFTPAPAAGINTFADAVDALLAGNTYTNVHTVQFPGGEVRGQDE